MYDKKKMFQVTRAGMVAVTIFICLNLLLDKKVMVGRWTYLGAVCMAFDIVSGVFSSVCSL